MARDQEERTLSTADLADRDSGDRARDAERDVPTAETDGADTDETGRLVTREESEGDRDEVSGEETSSPAGQTVETPEESDPDAHSELFETGQAERFQSQWEAIQSGFVDEPRRAVEEADALVADLMQRLAAGFAEERSQLETQWDRGDDVSTEDLRLALQRYRSFFGRLLQV
jgi:hypothetical protein